MQAAPELAREAGTVSVDGDTQQKAEAYTNLGLDTIFATLLAAHAGKPGLATEIPALRRALVTKVQTEYSPEQLRDIAGRVTSPDPAAATPEEHALFRELNAAFESPGKAIRSGVTATTEQPRFNTPALNKWLGLDTSGRTLTSPEAVAAPQTAPEPAPAPETPPAPSEGRTSLLRRGNLLKGPEPVVQPAAAPETLAAEPSAPTVTEPSPAAVPASLPVAETPKSSTQLTLPPVAAEPFKAFAASIPESEVYSKKDASGVEDYGRETEPHVTVLYGLTKHDPQLAQQVLANKGPVTVTLGKLSVFENPEYDVLKVDVKSPQLHKLNGELSKLPNENSFPDYQPHMTIAYLKKGEGKKYVGDTRFQGQKLTFNSVTFSPPKELRPQLGRPELPLVTAQPAAAPAPSAPSAAEPSTGAVPAAVPPQSRQEAAAHLRKLAPSLTDREAQAMLSDHDSAIDLSRRAFARIPKAEADAVDAWLQANEKLILRFDQADKEVSVFNKLKEASTPKELAAEFAFQSGNTSPQGVTARYLLHMLGLVADEKGFSRQDMAARVKTEVSKRYGEDAPFMMEQFLKEAATSPPVASPLRRAPASSKLRRQKLTPDEQQQAAVQQAVPDVAPETQGKIIARTAPVPRADIDNGTRETEFQIRKISEKEAYEKRETYRYNRWIVERRTIRKDLSNGQTETGEWGVIGVGENQKAAIKDALADTQFLRSESVDPRHAELAKESISTMEWKADKTKRLEQANREVKWAEDSVLRIKEDANKKYKTALKRAKLFEEAGKGTADPAQIKALQEKIGAEWKPQLDKAKANYEAAKENAKSIEAETQPATAPEPVMAAAEAKRIQDEQQRPLFSAAEHQGGLPAGQIEQFLAAQKESSAIPVVVVQHVTDLPQGIQDHMAAKNIPTNEVRGALWQGSMYFVGDNIGSLSDIPAILAHELFGHYGVEDVVGHDLQSFMEGVTDLYENHPLRAEIERLYNQGRTAQTPSEKLLIGREIVARISEDTSLNPSLWQRLVAWVQSWIRKLGFKLRVTEADIRAAIREGRNRARGQRTATQPGDPLYSLIDPESISDANELLRNPTAQEKPLIEALIRKPNDALFGHVIDTFKGLPQGAQNLLPEVQSRVKMMQEFGAPNDPRTLRQQLEAQFPHSPEDVQTGMAAGFFNAERLVANREAVSKELDNSIKSLQDALTAREKLSAKTVEIRAVRNTAKQMLEDWTAQMDKRIDSEVDAARRAQLEADRLLVNQLIPAELMDRVLREVQKLNRPTLEQFVAMIKDPNASLRDIKSKYSVFDGISEEAGQQALGVMRVNNELYQQLLTIKNAGVEGLAKDVAALDQARIGNKIDVRKWANEYAKLYRKSKDHADLLRTVNKDVVRALTRYVNHGAAFDWLNQTIASPKFAQNYSDTVQAMSATEEVKKGNGIEATYVNPNDPEGKEKVTIQSAVDLKTARENHPKLVKLAGWMMQYLDEGTDPVKKLAYQDALVEINDLLNNRQMSPDTGTRLTRSAFDFTRALSAWQPPNAVNPYLGGESGQRVKRDSKNYSEAMAKVMNQFGDLSNEIQIRVGKAAAAHKMSIDEWNEKINDPILQNDMARGDRHLDVGDSLPYGYTVKQEDMAAVRAQKRFSDKTSQDVQNLPQEIQSFVSVPIKVKRQTAPGKVGDRTVYTKPIPQSPNAVPRSISVEADQIADEWKKIEETYKGDPARIAEEKIKLINNPQNYNIFLSYFRTFSDPSFIVRSPLKDSALEVSRDINMGDVPGDFSGWLERLKEKEAQKTNPNLLSEEQVQGMVLSDLDKVMQALNKDKQPADTSPDAPLMDIIDARNFMNRPRGDTIALKGMYDLSLHSLPSQMQRAAQTLQVYGQALLNSWRSAQNLLQDAKVEMERQIKGGKTRGDVYKDTEAAMVLGQHFYKLKELDGILKDLTRNIDAFSNKDKNLRAFETQALSPKFLRLIKSYAISGLLMRPAVMANNFFGGVNKMNQMDAMLHLNGSMPVLSHASSMVKNIARTAGNIFPVMAHGISAGMLDTEWGRKWQEAAAQNPQLAKSMEQMLLRNMVRWAAEYKKASDLGLYNYAPFLSEIQKRVQLAGVGGEIRGNDPTKFTRNVDRMLNILQIGVDTGLLALRAPSAWLPALADAVINFSTYQKTNQMLGSLQLNVLDAFRRRVAMGEDPATIRLTPQEWFGKARTANMEQEFGWLQNIFSENGIDMDAAARDYYQRVQAAGPNAGNEWLVNALGRNALTQSVAAKLNRATWANRPQNMAHSPTGRFFMSLWGYALNENAQLGELLAKSARNPKKWATAKTLLKYGIPLLLSAIALGTLIAAPLIDKLQALLEHKKRSRPQLADIETPTDALKVIGIAAGPQLPFFGQFVNSMIQPDAPGRGGLVGGQINILPLSLANSFLQVIRQIGGTGEILRPLLQFNAQWNPASNIIINRTDYMEGWQAMQNDVATQRSHTPSNIELKKQSGGAPAQYSPVWGQYAAIKNELGKAEPDQAKIAQIRDEGIQKLAEKGNADPAKSFDRGLIASANKYLTIYGRELTQGEKDAIDAKKTPEELAESNRIDQNVANYAAQYGEPIPDFVRQTKDERAQNKLLGLPSNRSQNPLTASTGSGSSPSGLGLSSGSVGGGRPQGGSSGAVRQSSGGSGGGTSSRGLRGGRRGYGLRRISSGSRGIRVRGVRAARSSKLRRVRV